MKRNKFSLSHFRLMSGFMGNLIPLTWYEVLPGDTIQMSSSVFLRAAPLVTPVMHPIHVRVHHFFVPNRIIWQGSSVSGSSAVGGFENFITGGANGMDATLHPYVTLTSLVATSGLADYLGLPAARAGDTFGGQYNVSALPFRAYQLIWNEYYRDQDLQSLAGVATSDGQDTTTTLTIQNVDWQKDYYTTTRPWEAKGPSVSMFPPGSATGLYLNTGGTATTHPEYPGWPVQPANTQSVAAVGYDSSTDTPTPGTSVIALLGAASGADINALRLQFALQRFEEARARYGSRYVEYLRYLGVRSSDARLQRPEYLGGGTSTIQFSEVLQTAPSASGVFGGIGQMFGHGISAQRTNRFRRFFEEHGIVMTMLSVRPITVYSNPVRRGWLRGMTNAAGSTAPAGMAGTRYDYFQRELAGIGQQQVCGLEVDQSVGPGTAFGYQDRFDEYRRMESQVTGQFRNTLNTWHFARGFASAPALNGTFVSCQPSVLPFADQVNSNLYVMAQHSIQARRMVPKTGGSYVR